MKTLFLLYGLFCYLTFLLVFLYTIGFVGNFLVPKTMDSGTDVYWLTATATNIGLLGIFALQHSVMARQKFKLWWTSLIPEVIERSTYVMATNVALIALIYFWKPVNIIVWDVSGEPYVPVIWGICAIGWLIVLISTFLLDHFELFGLKQVYCNFRGKRMENIPFRTPLFYKYVRHPIYFGFAVAFWATPTMTAAHLLFAVGATGYSVVGALLEERAYVNQIRTAYQAYHKKVPFLFPTIGTKN